MKVKKSAPRWTESELSLFARASVCDTFLVAKLCYVSKICTVHGKILKFFIGFSLFSYRTLRRDNLLGSVQ